jgi:hypothetical protein
MGLHVLISQKTSGAGEAGGGPVPISGIAPSDFL